MPLLTRLLVPDSLQSERPPYQVAIAGLSLSAGLFAFAAIATGMTLLSGASEKPLSVGGLDPSRSSLALLSAVHSILAVGALWVLRILGSRAPELPASRPRRAPMEAPLAAYFIQRWTLLAGVGSFGPVVVLIGGMESSLPAASAYYGNLASAAVALALIARDVVTILGDGSSEAQPHP